MIPAIKTLTWKYTSDKNHLNHESGCNGFVNWESFLCVFTSHVELWLGMHKFPWYIFREDLFPALTSYKILVLFKVGNASIFVYWFRIFHIENKTWLSFKIKCYYIKVCNDNSKMKYYVTYIIHIWHTYLFLSQLTLRTIYRFHGHGWRTCHGSETSVDFKANPYI